MYERYIQILYADMPKKKRLFIMNSLFFERQETQNRPCLLSATAVYLRFARFLAIYLPASGFNLAIYFSNL